MNDMISTGGLFWVLREDEERPDLYTILPAEAGQRLNHKKAWENAAWKPQEAKNKPFNYFPRGRVELKKDKAIIFLHPDICTAPIIELVKDTFGLNGVETVRVVADGSRHYQYIAEE